MSDIVFFTWFGEYVLRHTETQKILNNRNIYDKKDLIEYYVNLYINKDFKTGKALMDELYTSVPSNVIVESQMLVHLNNVCQKLVTHTFTYEDVQELYEKGYLDDVVKYTPDDNILINELKTHSSDPDTNIVLSYVEKYYYFDKYAKASLDDMIQNCRVTLLELKKDESYEDMELDEIVDVIYDRNNIKINRKVEDEEKMEMNGQMVLDSEALKNAIRLIDDNPNMINMVIDAIPDEYNKAVIIVQYLTFGDSDNFVEVVNTLNNDVLEETLELLKNEELRATMPLYALSVIDEYSNSRK